MTEQELALLYAASLQGGAKAPQPPSHSQGQAPAGGDVAGIIGLLARLVDAGGAHRDAAAAAAAPAGPSAFHPFQQPQQQHAHQPGQLGQPQGSRWPQVPSARGQAQGEETLLAKHLEALQFWLQVCDGWEQGAAAEWVVVRRACSVH